jgi:DNA-nicking Smr family endonuclease
MTRQRVQQPHTGLSAGEQALWDHTARSIERLAKVKSRVLDGADAFLEAMTTDPAIKRGASSHQTDATLPGLPARPATSLPPSAPGARKPVPPIAGFDRKSAKRLRSGQTDIEARIDLHGMRQEEAHHALTSFLMSCHTRGLRWVLVITGKGGPRRNKSEESENFEMAERSEPGVLRRNVPRWLTEPDLRSFVVSYTSASISHGGDGAMYVQLRRNR